MSEEEIINILSDEIVSLNVGHEKYEQAVKGLLDLYNKEKEKNRKYLVNLTHEQYIKLVEQIRSEINKEWRDVIKAKIEEVSNGTYDAKIVLQSLLEKE